jgi:hypothetical protein
MSILITTADDYEVIGDCACCGKHEYLDALTELCVNCEDELYTCVPVDYSDEAGYGVENELL